jgi:Na+/serine symporter
MARKRKKSLKKSAAKAFDIDLAVIILIVLGILACIVIYGDSGVAGETLSPALGGCFGGLKYLIPIGIFRGSLCCWKR